MFCLSLHTSPFVIPALATIEADNLPLCLVEGLEARLASLRDAILDIPTAERAVERAQVRSLCTYLP